MDAMAQWEQRYFLQLAKQWAAANGDELDPNFLLVPRLGEGVEVGAVGCLIFGEDDVDSF